MLVIRKSASGVLLTLSVVALLAGAALAENTDKAAETGPTLDQFAEALARAQTENKPVVLDFFTDW